MVSVLRTLQAQWNELVPTAQARGIPRVRLLNAPLETIEYRRQKLEWLRAQLGTAGDLDALSFGVELEFILGSAVSEHSLAELLTQAGVPCRSESYNHTLRDTWKIVWDGSLGHPRGRELVSPPLRGEQGFEQIRKACAVLKSKNCKVSVRCGLHVHIGAQTESVDFFRNLVKLYASAERSIDTFMAPSRRGPSGGNGYCRSLTVNNERLDAAQTVDDVARALGQRPGREHVRSSGRYCKLNLQSFWQHGTVEFRHHQGTVEAQKVENWVRLCLRMALASRTSSKTAATVQELMEAVEAAQAERDYFNGRVRFFQPNRFTAYGDEAQIPPRRRT